MDIKQKIISAYQQLVKNDFYLLYIGASERSITHKLAEYLQKEFPEYHVDCEYNKNINNNNNEKNVPIWKKKRDQLTEELQNPNTNEGRQNNILQTLLDGEVSVYPDIIIHRRETADNFIVIEAKKSTNNTGNDREKLIEYKNGLGYINAYFITFPIQKTIESFSVKYINELIENI